MGDIMGYCFIDEVFLNLIQDELIELDDFVPPLFLTNNGINKRNRWIRENNKQNIINLNKEYKLESFGLGIVNEGEFPIELYIFRYEAMKNFINKYPQYSQLIKDRDAFEKRLWELKKELYGL